MTQMRDVAVLRFSEPVSGAVTRRRYGGNRMLASRVSLTQVHPAVLEAAQQALREGERMVFVSPSEVRLVRR